MAVVPSLIGLVPSKIPFTFSICQGHCSAEMALKMGALQFSYVKPWYQLSDRKENLGSTSTRQIACGSNYRMPKSTMMTGQSTMSKIGV
jgi:hypothetical protein